MPWEGPLQSILESIQGPVARIVAVIIIIATGLALAFGDTSGGFRKLIQIVFGLSIAFAASSFFLSFFSFSGGAGCCCFCNPRGSCRCHGVSPRSWTGVAGIAAGAAFPHFGTGGRHTPCILNAREGSTDGRLFYNFVSKCLNPWLARLSESRPERVCRRAPTMLR